MSQTRPKKIAFVIDEDLRLVLKPPKRRRVNDPISVPLKLASCYWRVLRVNTPS
jgi:hypothetical protein